MSSFIKIGNSILKNSDKDKNSNLLRKNSVFSETMKPKYLKKNKIFLLLISIIQNIVAIIIKILTEIGHN